MNIRTFAPILILGATLGACSESDNAPNETVQALLDGAYDKSSALDMDSAIARAREAYPDALIVDAEFSLDEEDLAAGEPPTYDVLMLVDGVELEIELHAETGELLVDDEVDEDDDERTEDDREEEETVANIQNGAFDASTAIAIEDAIAFARGEFPDATFIEVNLELEFSDNEPPVWEALVLLVDSEELYEIEMDALTGEVMEIEREN